MSEKSRITEYYIKQKSKLLAQFEKYLGIIKDTLAKKYNNSEIEQLYMQMREVYERLIPEIPYIGGKKNPNTSLLLDCVAILPIIRILEKEDLAYRKF